MQIVELELSPPPPSYSSFAAAVAGAEAQSEQAQAKLDTARISEATLEGGQFGASSCHVSFSNGLQLAALANEFRVKWKVTRSKPSPISVVPPRQLQFKPGLVVPFDPASVLSTISGSEFVMLAVTGRDLLIYTQGNEILWLSAHREKQSGDDLLYAFLET